MTFLRNWFSFNVTTIISALIAVWHSIRTRVHWLQSRITTIFGSSKFHCEFIKIGKYLFLCLSFSLSWNQHIWRKTCTSFIVQPYWINKVFTLFKEYLLTLQADLVFHSFSNNLTQISEIEIESFCYALVLIQTFITRIIELFSVLGKI